MRQESPSLNSSIALDSNICALWSCGVSGKLWGVLGAIWVIIWTAQYPDNTRCLVNKLLL
jgi:hypothetical protein